MQHRHTHSVRPGLIPPKLLAFLAREVVELPASVCDADADAIVSLAPLRRLLYTLLLLFQRLQPEETKAAARVVALPHPLRERTYARGAVVAVAVADVEEGEVCVLERALAWLSPDMAEGARAQAALTWLLTHPLTDSLSQCTHSLSHTH